MNETVTLEVTLNGETRAVEFDIYVRSDGTAFGHSDAIASARIGRGAKVHRVQLGIHSVEERNRKFIQSNRIRRDEQGREWYISQMEMVLNRHATVIGWADIKPPTSRHIMERFQS